MKNFRTYQVMGIMNLTPDSFVQSTRRAGDTMDMLVSRVDEMLADGMDILDLGAESTRPGATALTWREEWERLEHPLRAIRSTHPDLTISIDTYHPETAELAMEAGADIINDISGGSEQMDEVAARAHVPYILTYPEAGNMLDWMMRRTDALHRRGVADVILDPGLGFGKTTAECWQTLRELSQLKILDLPILAGLSRKSMLWRTLGISAEEALNATTAAHMLALEGGANILRAHDVREARECIMLYKEYTKI